MADGQYVIICFVFVFLYAGGGFVGVFLPLMFLQAGLNDDQIGIISSTLPLAQIAGVVLLGVLFDRRVAWRKPLFAGAMVLSACFYVALPLVILLDRANAFAPAIVFAVCAWAINAAAVTLMDAMAVERTLQNQYGKLRLFGALGYGLGESSSEEENGFCLKRIRIGSGGGGAVSVQAQQHGLRAVAGAHCAQSRHGRSRGHLVALSGLESHAFRFFCNLTLFRAQKCKWTRLQRWRRRRRRRFQKTRDRFRL